MQPITYSHQAVSTGASNVPQSRCVESIIKEIWAELAETLNSSVNLADKLRGTSPAQAGGSQTPDPSDVLSWLERISNTIKEVNQQLGHAHNAISG